MDIENALVVRIEASMSKLEKALASGQIVAIKTATQIENRFAKMNQTINTTSGRAATGLLRIANVSRAGRFVIQNTANQIGDIAVQMQSGTNAARALGQQIPQLLGGFAALGGTLGILGPLLATVAAIGIPVVTMLLRSGDSAEEAADKIKTFEEKLKAAQSALDAADGAIVNLAEGGLEDLRKKYGEVTAAVIDLSKELYAIQERAARVKLEPVVDEALGQKFQQEVEKLFGNLAGALVETVDTSALQDLLAEIERTRANIEQRQQAGFFVDPAEIQQLREMEAEAEVLQGQFQNIAELGGGLVNPDQAVEIQRLAQSVREAFDASNYAGAADALGQLRAAMEGTGKASQDVLDRLTETEDAMRQMAKVTAEAKDSTEGIAAASGKISFDDGVASAEALANALGTALARAQHLAAIEAKIRHDQIDQRFADEAKLFEQPLTPVPITQEMRDTVFPPAKPSRGSGGGGGGGGGGATKVDDMAAKFAALRAQLDPTFAALQKMAEAQDTLNWALEQGIIDLPEYQRLMAEANRTILDGASSLQSVQQEMSGFLSTFLTDMYHGLRNGEGAWRSFRDAAVHALDSIAEQAIKVMANAAVQMLFNSLLGGSGIVGSAVQVGASNLAVRSFEGGGFTGTGARVGGVDGRGGFPAILHPNEVVVDRTKGQAAAAAVQVNISGNIPRDAVRQRGGRVDIDLGAMIASVIGSGAADKALGRRYGLAPRGV